MTRQLFLTLSSLVALLVAIFALGFPAALLAGKGVQPDSSVQVWVREVGALIFATGTVTFLVRQAPDSLTLRGVLLGNALLHLLLLPIELVAYSQGVITQLSGVIPNSALHAVLALGFLTYARRIQREEPR